MPVWKAIRSLLPEDKIKGIWKLLTNGLIDTIRKDVLENVVTSLETLGDVTKIGKMLAAEVGGALDWYCSCSCHHISKSTSPS